MIKPFVAVAIAVVTLTGCANNNTLSGDVFTASQAKQVQNGELRHIDFCSPGNYSGW